MRSETNGETLPFNKEYEADVQLTKVNTISEGLEDKAESASQTIDSTVSLVQQEQKHGTEVQPDKGSNDYPPS